MNYPTPIKRHPSLVAFSRDHHFGLLLVWKIKHGLDNDIAPERISNYVLYFFEQDLKLHFEEEEQMLFPLLPIDDVMRKRVEDDHAIMRRLIGQLENDRDNKNLLLQFAQILNDHIRFEERELFAALQLVAGREKLANMELHGNERGSEMDAGWNDQFWTIKKRAPITDEGKTFLNQ